MFIKLLRIDNVLKILLLTFQLKVVFGLFLLRPLNVVPIPFSAKLVSNNNIDSNNNKTVLNVTINVPLLNLPIKLTINNNRREASINSCGDQFVFESGEGLKAHSTPKGLCYGCCKISSTDINFNIYIKGNAPLKIFQSEIGSRPLNLVKNAPTIIYIHGFLEAPPIGSAEVIRDAYLSRSEIFNVILMDWSELATFPWYLHAVENTKIAGKVLATFILTYIKQEINQENLHIIGFSLGAHVAAYSSRFLKNILRLPRITGLDPAFPGFQGNNKLSKKDADFVDIIHTDGGNFGILYPIGHVDFYPNGGTYFQPGCWHRDLAKKHKLMNAIACSHQKAYHYFSESVKSPENFPAIKCTWGSTHRDCNEEIIAYMGFNANPNYSSGSYYLRTNKDIPYGRGAL
ncbi:endothelial lipase-like isoform X2 [Onthophagus taurus]|uniref:endothelial lipase-like isoform X2 n=1 Tax=Onthophagus taurus TaxID=166361 RepID=UPI0039BDB558